MTRKTHRAVVCPTGRDHEEDDEQQRDKLEGRISELEEQRAADATTIGYLKDDVVAEHTMVENLQAALVNARRIGAAVGIIMATWKLTDDEAFDVLRRASMCRQQKLRDIAESVLLTGSIAPRNGEGRGV